ncbi:MAG: hypothetical protein AB1556_05735 [Bacillota bacterium]
MKPAVLNNVDAQRRTAGENFGQFSAETRLWFFIFFLRAIQFPNISLLIAKKLLPGKLKHRNEMKIARHFYLAFAKDRYLCPATLAFLNYTRKMIG